MIEALSGKRKENFILTQVYKGKFIKKPLFSNKYALKTL